MLLLLLVKTSLEFFQARMKACLSQKASIPIQEQYIQSVPTNPIISNIPRQYYQPTFPYSTNTQQINMNFYPQTQFINRNVRCNEKKDLFHEIDSFSNQLFQHIFGIYHLLQQILIHQW